jgi:hypothetical protein
MSTAEAAPETAEAQDPGHRSKSSSPRQIPVIGVVAEDEEMQVWAGVCAFGGGIGVRSGEQGRGPEAGRVEVRTRVETGGACGTKVPGAGPTLWELRCLQGGLVVVSQPIWGLVP